MMIMIGDHDDEDLQRLATTFRVKNRSFSLFLLGLPESEYDIAWNDGPVLRCGGTVLSRKEFERARIVFFRRWRMDSPPSVRCRLDAPSETAFAEREWNAAMASALCQLEDISNSHWLNSTRSICDPDLKLHYLATAERFGLPVPLFDVATSVRLAASSGSRWVCKAINKNHRLDEERHFPTSSIDDDDLQSAMTARSPCPSFVQRRIDGLSEVRIYFLDGMCVEVAIESTVDYDDISMVPEQLKITSHDSPIGFRNSLTRFCTHFGLRYCVFDTKIDATGTQWLFDVTPNGSWSWLDRAGYNITDRISMALERLAERPQGER